MTWAFKWREEVSTGQYYDLLNKGFFKDRPEDIEPEVGFLGYYLDAFRELGTCRPGGLDLQPIPFTAIIEYSRIYELGDAEDFYYIIRQLDDTLLDLNEKKNKSQEKKGKDASTVNHKSNNNKGRHKGRT